MVDFTVDFKDKQELLKPVNGVVNGPRNEVYPWVDVSEHFMAASIPFVRLHDTIYPNAPEVDISQVFPDFNADAQDPANYDFRKTDIYLRDIAAANAEIYYRLGETIEHHSVKNHVFPPKDPIQWAKICLGIVRHYNEGWADGFYYNIRNWEIWEEADCPNGRLWMGTPEDYFKLYHVTARMLKKHDPSLLVGGYASCGEYPMSFTRKFFTYVKEQQLPLDFFTFDIYTDNPEDIKYKCHYIQKLMDEADLQDVPIRIAEWNCLGFTGQKIFEGTADDLKEGFRRMSSHIGASFYVGTMLLMQDMPLENAALYSFNTTSEWSVFDLFGSPHISYYAFLAYKYLMDCRHRVKSEVNARHKQVYCCAGINEKGDEGALLISNFGGDAKEYSISIEMPETQKEWLYDVYIIDATRCLERVDSGNFEQSLDYSIYIPVHGVVEILLK